MKKLYKNVIIGKNANIGEFAIIGEPPKGYGDGDLTTVIGDSCIIRSHSVIYAGNKIGNNFQTGHGVNIREFNEIGNNVSIGTHSVIEHHIKIEDNVRIHSNVFIPEYSCLKRGCWIGPGVTMTNVLHPLCKKAKECIKGATIGENTKIGANATILPDIVMGKNCLVGAGSLVTKNLLEDNCVYAGNPAKKIKHIKDLTCPYNLIDKPYEVEEEE
jgi:acetyltransferase-like isoleucine patch superfamily enzyme